MAHQFLFNPYILDKLPAPSTGFDVVQDLLEPRLRMYITQRGVKSFFVRKRVNGCDKRIIIGQYPEVGVEYAREQVDKILKESSKKVSTRRKKILFKDFINLYLKNKVRREEHSLNKLKRSINTHLNPLFEKNIQDLTCDDLQKTLDNIKGRAIALRMQELLQSVFNYAMVIGYRKENPISKLDKIAVIRRERKLNKSKFNKLLSFVKKETDVNFRSAFLMLFYGFAPKSKIFKMRWEDLDFNQDLWCGFPLSDKSVLLLQKMSQECEWVFVGRGRFHLTDPRVAWKKIVTKAGMPDITMDDVHKFLMHQLVWSPDKNILRENMNNVLIDLCA